MSDDVNIENPNPRDCCNHPAEEFKLKIGVPTFSSNRRIKAFLDWLMEIECLFNYMDIPEKKLVELVIYRLKSSAFSQWEQLQVMWQW